MKTDEVLLKVPFPYKSLVSFSSQETINSHQYLKAKFLISEETYLILLHERQDNKVLKLYEKGTEDTILFCLISKYSLARENELCYIMIEAKGVSCLLEFGEYSCTFQDINKTIYSEMLSVADSKKENSQILFQKRLIIR